MMRPSCWAYGCSFTAGTELLDHVIHPDADQIKRQQGVSYFVQNHRKQHARRGELEITERSMVWAADLSRALGMTFENHARAGESLAETLYKIECHLQESPPALMLVGLTTPSRMISFNPQGTHSWLLNTPQTWPQSGLDPNTVLSLFPEELCLWLHLTYVLRLLQLADRSAVKIRLFFMNDLEKDVRACAQRNPGVFNQRFQDRWREIAEHKDSYVDHSLYSLCRNKEDQHGGNHPRRHVHEQLARLALPWLQSGLG